jgi:hypothetical protein
MSNIEVYSPFLEKKNYIITMKQRLFFILLGFILFQCDFGDDGLPNNSQLLQNTDISDSPQTVSPWTSLGNQGFSIGVSTEVFRSGNRSLFIENLDSLTLNSASWRQNYRGPMPSEGRKLTLRTYLKGENIELKSPESNVYISVRMFPVEDSDGTTINRFISTKSRVSVSGTFDWEPLSVTLPSVPEEIEYISVFLVMGPQTKGKVYFDDITLTVE